MFDNVVSDSAVKLFV